MFKCSNKEKLFLVAGCYLMVILIFKEFKCMFSEKNQERSNHTLPADILKLDFQDVRTARKISENNRKRWNQIFRRRADGWTLDFEDIINNRKGTQHMREIAIFRRDLAEDVVKVMMNLTENTHGKTASTLQLLVEVTNRLDRHSHHLSLFLLQQKTRIELDASEEETPLQSITNNSHKLLQINSNTRYQFVTTYDLTLLILNYNISDYQKLQPMLKIINESMGRIHATMLLNCNIAEKLYGVLKMLQVETMCCDNNTLAKLLNHALLKVRTRYIYIVRHIDQMNSENFLDRRIHMIKSIPYADVVGEIVRYISERWKIGCFQTHISNYYLTYIEGYRYSIRGCMVCDYVEGNFVVKTELFRQVHFNEEIHSELIFHDWFLRLKLLNIMVTVCPEISCITYKLFDYVPVEKEKLTHFAHEWNIINLFIPPRIAHTFSCEELESECNLIMQGDFGYASPPCCLSQYFRILNEVHKFSFKYNLPYEMKTELAIGAIKLKNILPWDVDIDIIFTPEIYNFVNETKELLWNLSFMPPKRLKDFNQILSKELYIELYVSNVSSTHFLPNDHQSLPTLVHLHNMWLNCHSYPGLHVRNSYGRECLKHAVPKVFFGEQDENHFHPGRWNVCNNLSFHNCLVHYPTDGSIDFL